MEHRPLGRTGVSVSKFCLGAMMFGAWGNPDHDESIRIIHAALDAGINFIDTADVYGAGRVRGDRRQGARRRPPRRRHPRHQVPQRRWARTPTSSGNSRRWIIRAVEDSLRRLGTDWIDLYQVHRPDPRHRHRGDARRAQRPRAPGQGPLHRLLHLPGQPDRRGAVGRRATGACSASSPSSRRTRSSSAPSRPTSCPRARATAWASCPTARWPAAGCRAAGARTPGSSPPRAPAGCPSASTSRSPANQRKLDAVEELAQLADEAGITLIQLAIAFVLNHPAITAAIIGPRTMEQLESQLAAADVVLDEAVLDRIDEIVPPGTTINPADNSFANPALEPAARRR